MKICCTETSRLPATNCESVTMHYRAYQPLLPSGNRYLQQKWDQASYNLHIRKIKSAKPTINTTPPKTYSHLSLKMKKLKLEDEWTMKIQRENNAQTDKISHIMRTTGRVDNKNYYERKSLGKEKKQQELFRITKENQKIQIRLEKCRPHYDVKSWHEDWLKTLKVMDAIARYPRGTTNKRKGPVNPRKRSCIKEKTFHAEETTHESANSETIKKSKQNENRTKITRKDAGLKKCEDMTTHHGTKPEMPQKFTSADTAKNPGSSDTIQVTPDKHCHDDVAVLAPDGTEKSKKSSNS